jgi:hypothetical protein
MPPGPPPGGFGGGGPGGGRGPGGGGFGGPWGGGSGGGPTLTIAAFANNLTNRVNSAAPIGNLASPSFGESLSSAGGFGRGPGGGGGAGNRVIELQIRASF